MTSNAVLLPVLFLLGAAAGVTVMYDRVGEPVQEPATAAPAFARTPAINSDHPMADAFAAYQASDRERIQVLEQQVDALIERIEELESSAQAGDENDEAGAKGALALPGQSTADMPVSSMSPAVTTENLVKAGIDVELATDIVRRRNEIDLKLLELRDRASRDGYFGSERYMEEASALNEMNRSLREEIGDEYYDSFLYASGRSNRVRVASVMMGSPAETAGMKDGDLIINYDNTRMFNWNELQEATSSGERGEYVNVTVLRDGQLLNLWLPRGPLGIRLGSARVQP